MKQSGISFGAVEEADVDEFLGILRMAELDVVQCAVCHDDIQADNFAASQPKDDKVVLYCSKPSCFSELLLSLRKKNGNGLSE